MFALLERQTQASYEALFRFIAENSNVDPTCIVVDFEKAVHNAVHVVFGDHVTIRGCFYHLTQSTWRKIQALGLSDVYKTNDEFRLFCGQLDALALLPLAQVNEGFSHLKHTAPIEAQELVDYFDATYISGSLRRRPQANGFLGVRFRRSQPQFPPEVWNVHDASVNNHSRTNNVCEGWNNGFAHLVGQHHPTI